MLDEEFLHFRLVIAAENESHVDATTMFLQQCVRKFLEALVDPFVPPREGLILKTNAFASVPCQLQNPFQRFQDRLENSKVAVLPFLADALALFGDHLDRAPGRGTADDFDDLWKVGG